MLYVTRLVKSRPSNKYPSEYKMYRTRQAVGVIATGLARDPLKRIDSQPLIIFLHFCKEE